MIIEYKDGTRVGATTRRHVRRSIYHFGVLDRNKWSFSTVTVQDNKRNEELFVEFNLGG